MRSARPIRKLLIANRGEIALRIARSAADAGIETCAIAPRDDAQSLHALRADHCVTLPGAGAGAYLDAQAVIRAGLQAGCDALHPGYGFLSESPDFAAAVEAAGMIFVGPTRRRWRSMVTSCRRAPWPNGWACRCCRAATGRSMPPRPPPSWQTSPGAPR